MTVGMTTQQPVDTFDGELDLRSYLDVLIRYKWLVIGMTAAVVALGALVSFMQAPSYESSVVVALPAAQGEAGLGLNPSGYEEFAISEAVVKNARKSLGWNLNDRSRSGEYNVLLREEGMEGQDALLVVTASANTPVDSLSLAQEWVYAFDNEVLALLEGQLARQQAASELASARLTGELADGENLLAAMDQQTSLSLSLSWAPGSPA